MGLRKIIVPLGIALVIAAGCGAPYEPEDPSKPVVNVAHARSAAEFQRLVLEAKTPVFVDFTAVWCGPCQKMAPVLNALAPQYEGRVAVVKVDVDVVPQAAAQFGVQNLPTFLVFRSGKVVKRLVGSMSQSRLRGALDDAAGGK